MKRDERKKMLIVEGMFHRLELVQAAQQLRQDTRPAAMMEKLPGVITLLASSNALPLLGSLLTVVAGRGRGSRLVRRLLVMAGVGSALAAVVRRWRMRRGAGAADHRADAD